MSCTQKKPRGSGSRRPQAEVEGDRGDPESRGGTRGEPFAPSAGDLGLDPDSWTC